MNAALTHVVCCYLSDETATIAFAERLTALLRPGDLILLRGDLGAGKTTFTRGLARGLSSPALVSSPTFTLIHEYDGGRLPIVHMDAYRLSGPEDRDSVGLTEYLNRAEGVIAIEWPERIEAALPPERLEITLEECDEGRQVTLQTFGASWAERKSAIDDLFREYAAC